MIYVYRFLWPLRLGWLWVCCLYKEVYLQIFELVSFWLHGLCGSGKIWPVNQVNHTSWVAIVTPTDRPKSVRNRSVIELFVALFVMSFCPFDISVGVGAFVIGLNQISSFFSYDEKSWMRINHVVNPQCVEVLFFTRSPRCLKIYAVNTYMTFIFSWLGNVLHSDTLLIVAIIAEGCRIWEKSTVSQSPRICRFSFCGNTNFHRMLFCPYTSETTGW